MSAERPALAARWSAHNLASIVAVAVLVVALSTEQSYYAPTWPLTVTAVILGLGLAADSIARRAGGQPARAATYTVVAAVTLIVVVVTLATQRELSPKWPLTVTAVLVGLGLAGTSFTRPDGRRRPRPPAHVLAALTALLVLVYAASINFYFSPSWPLTVPAVVLGLGLAVDPLARRVGGEAARRSAFVVTAAGTLVCVTVILTTARDLSPRWPLVCVAISLGLGLAAGSRARPDGRLTTRAFEHTLATAAALVILADAASIEYYLSPSWPLTVAAVILGLGLAAGPVARRVGGETARTAVFMVTAGVTVLVLVLALSTEHELSPKWPLTLTAAILGLGLAAEPLTRSFGRPHEKLLSDRVDELSRTRRGALDVQASELRRIERDLHDGAQVRLVALSLKLGRAEERFRDRSGAEEVSAVLREAREDATAAIRELRELARGIAPPVLADRGLEAAVRSLADRSGIAVSVTASLPRRPVPAVETAAYFVVAESLTNAVKHAPGTHVEMRLDEHGGDLFVEVTDFGPGGADRSGGGLTGLRQRVEALDGSLSVTSPPGVGTQVEAVLPCGW